MASAKQKVSLPRRILHHKFYLILIIILLGVAGYFGYEKYAAWQNKRDFQQARAAIDSIYADIVRQVGPPDNSRRSNDCSRSYQEFTGYGDMTCHTDLETIYGLSGQTEANQQLAEIQAIINKSKLVGATPESTHLEDKFVVSQTYHVASDSYKFGALTCTANYVYDTPSETDLKIKDPSKKTFEITLGCYGPASSQYYPLAY